MSTSSEPSLQKRILGGAVWTVAMRWSVRLIGLVSTMILARLLSPEDFGLVAMAMIVITFIDTLFDFGVQTYLIHKSDATDEDFNTAWTLRLLQGAAATVLLLAISPLPVAYFDAPELLPVFLCLAFHPLLLGLENIGVIRFQKDLRFGRDFQFMVSRKVITFVITIVSAFVLRNHWALVIGTLAGGAVGSSISYILHPFRPRFSLTRIGAMLSFSTWVLLRNAGTQLQITLDRFIVGGRTDAAALGIYTVASEVAALPTSVFLEPLGRVLLPGISIIQSDMARVRAAFLNVFGAIVASALPMTIGLMLVAEDVVYVLLGAKWVQVIEPLRILAFVGMASSLHHTVGIMLVGLGRVRIYTVMVWTNLAAFVFLAVAIFPDAKVIGIALIQAALGGFMAALVLGAAVFLGLLTIGGLVRSLWRPVLAGAAMAAAVYAVHPALAMGHLPRLIVEAAVGATVYGLVLFAAWLLARCPDGPEQFVISAVQARFAKPATGSD